MHAPSVPFAAATLLALAGTIVPRAARAQDRAALEAQLRQRITASGATVGVFFADLTRPDSIAINADLRYHAASTMKVAVMVQVFRDIDAGRLRLDQPIPVVNAFRSIVGDSAYRLDRTDDSDSSLYTRVGRALPVADLVNLMITVSSNLATNLLVQQVGADRVQATLAELGVDSMTVRRGVEDGPAFRAGLNNTTTARALGQLLDAIVDGRAASPASCGRMLRVLLHQRFKDAIPAGLPPGTRVAHKTGEITALLHDAGIVYVRGHPRYVLVVLTRGLEQRTASAALVADLTRLIHAFVVPPVSR